MQKRGYCTMKKHIIIFSIIALLIIGNAQEITAAALPLQEMKMPFCQETLHTLAYNQALRMQAQRLHAPQPQPDIKQQQEAPQSEAERVANLLRTVQAKKNEVLTRATGKKIKDMLKKADEENDYRTILTLLCPRKGNIQPEDISPEYAYTPAQKKETQDYLTKLLQKAELTDQAHTLIEQINKTRSEKNNALFSQACNQASLFIEHAIEQNMPDIVGTLIARSHLTQQEFPSLHAVLTKLDAQPDLIKLHDTMATIRNDLSAKFQKNAQAFAKELVHARKNDTRRLPKLLIEATTILLRLHNDDYYPDQDDYQFCKTIIHEGQFTPQEAHSVAAHIPLQEIQKKFNDIMNSTNTSKNTASLFHQDLDSGLDGLGPTIEEMADLLVDSIAQQPDHLIKESYTLSEQLNEARKNNPAILPELFKKSLALFEQANREFNFQALDILLSKGKFTPEDAYTIKNTSSLKQIKKLFNDIKKAIVQAKKVESFDSFGELLLDAVKTGKFNEIKENKERKQRLKEKKQQRAAMKHLQQKEVDRTSAEKKKQQETAKKATHIQEQIAKNNLLKESKKAYEQALARQKIEEQQRAAKKIEEEQQRTAKKKEAARIKKEQKRAAKLIAREQALTALAENITAKTIQDVQVDLKHEQERARVSASTVKQLVASAAPEITPSPSLVPSHDNKIMQEKRIMPSVLKHSDMAIQLCDAAKEGRTQDLIQLLTIAGNPNNYHADYLLPKGVVKTPGLTQVTPLDVAQLYGQHACIKILMDYGARTEETVLKHIFPEHTMSKAAEMGNYAQLRNIVDAYHGRPMDKAYRKALEIALRSEKIHTFIQECTAHGTHLDLPEGYKPIKNPQYTNCINLLQQKIAEIESTQ